MSRKAGLSRAFKGFVETLQAYNLDERIEKEYKRNSFRPIVHPEVLLLDWLGNNGNIEPARFYGGWMYIGSSKPTCRLCKYYFEGHRSSVGHRATHGNLYSSWRVPDVLPSQGPHALDSRQVMVDRILQRVRKDAFDIIERKVPPSCKADDSNTFTAAVTLEERWTLAGSATTADDITSLMAEVSID